MGKISCQALDTVAEELERQCFKTVNQSVKLFLDDPVGNPAGSASLRQHAD